MADVEKKRKRKRAVKSAEPAEESSPKKIAAPRYFLREDALGRAVAPRL